MRKGARGDDSNTRSLKRARAGGANKLSFGKKLVMVAPGGTATSAVMVSGAVTLEQVTRSVPLLTLFFKNCPPDEFE